MLIKYSFDMRAIPKGKIVIAAFLFCLVFLIHAFSCTKYIYIVFSCTGLFELLQFVNSRFTLVALIMLIYGQYNLFLGTVTENDLFKLLLIASASDASQEITGRLFGRNKIGWISPNKTYEGYIFGYLLMAVLNYFLFLETFTNLTLICFLGNIGGLYFSLIKRQFNVKDYSNLLGAHGGTIERIDSVLIPYIYFCIRAYFK